MWQKLGKWNYRIIENIELGLSLNSIKNDEMLLDLVIRRPLITICMCGFHREGAVDSKVILQKYQVQTSLRMTLINRRAITQRDIGVKNKTKKIGTRQTVSMCTAKGVHGKRKFKGLRESECEWNEPPYDWLVKIRNFIKRTNEETRFIEKTASQKTETKEEKMDRQCWEQKSWGRSHKLATVAFY